MSAPSLTTGVGNTTPGSRRVELPVSGLRCPTCGQSIEGALRAVPGVTRATINLATERAFVVGLPRMDTRVTRVPSGMHADLMS